MVRGVKKEGVGGCSAGKEDIVGGCSAGKEDIVGGCSAGKEVVGDERGSTGFFFLFVTRGILERG